MNDQLGTARVVTTNTGVVCYDADFSPYGGEGAWTSTCLERYRFEGKERDAETGNDDFGARYYSNRFGRWLSADWSSVPAPVPYANLTNPQTLNLYAMASDDPESFADLDGHQQASAANAPCSYENQKRCNNQQKQEQSAAQTIANMAKSHGDERDPKLAAKLALLDAVDKAVEASKKEVEVGTSMDIGPVGVDHNGNTSINAPAEWKEAGVSVDIKIHAPSEENTAGEVAVGAGKHLAVGTAITNDGTPQGLIVRLGPSVGTPVQVSAPVGPLDKIIAVAKDIFHDAVMNLAKTPYAF